MADGDRTKSVPAWARSGSAGQPPGRGVLPLARRLVEPVEQRRPGALLELRRSPGQLLPREKRQTLFPRAPVSEKPFPPAPVRLAWLTRLKMARTAPVPPAKAFSEEAHTPEMPAGRLPEADGTVPRLKEDAGQIAEPVFRLLLTQAPRQPPVQPVSLPRQALRQATRG